MFLLARLDLTYAQGSWTFVVVRDNFSSYAHRPESHGSKNFIVE